MPLVGTTEMFKKAYEGHYAIGAFNVNNMEIIQGIMEAAKEENSPVILQASEGIYCRTCKNCSSGLSGNPNCSSSRPWLFL